MTADISTRLSSTSHAQIAAEKVRMAKMMEYGNISSDVEAYKRVLNLSPYHMPLLMAENRPISDILMTVDSDWPQKYHARKMIAKVREASSTDPLYAFYHEFSAQMYSEE